MSQLLVLYECVCSFFVQRSLSVPAAEQDSLNIFLKQYFYWGIFPEALCNVGFEKCPINKDYCYYTVKDVKHLQAYSTET